MAIILESRAVLSDDERELLMEHPRHEPTRRDLILDLEHRVERRFSTDLYIFKEHEPWLYEAIIQNLSSYPMMDQE